MSFDQRQLGGVGLLLGSAATFANGLIAYTQGNTEAVKAAGIGRMGASAFGGGTGLLMMRYGNQPAAKQLQTLEEQFCAYLKEQDVPLDAEALNKASIEQRKNWFNKFEDFANAHPMQVATIYNTLSGTGFLISGIKRVKEKQTMSGYSNIVTFSMILAGTLACNLIPEKTHEQVVKEGKDGTLWGSVLEKPMLAVMVPLFASDLTFGPQAIGEYKDYQTIPADHPYKKWALALPALSAFSLVSNFTGDALSGTGSKKVGGDPDERNTAREELMQFSARILAQQPPETRQKLITLAANYLSKQEPLRMSDFDPTEIQSKIEQHLATLPVSAPSSAATIR